MQKKIGTADVEFQIMMECWKFYQKHYEPKNDAEWDALVDDAQSIGNKYKQKLAKRILLAFVNDIEERCGVYDKTRLRRN